MSKNRQDESATVLPIQRSFKVHVHKDINPQNVTVKDRGAVKVVEVGSLWLEVQMLSLIHI